MHRQSGFTLIELMIVVAILGILAVVAIPAFVRYMRLAKTAEVIRNMNKIQQGAVRYYTVPHYDEKGTPVSCRFPLAMMGPTPGPGIFGGFCCTDGEPDGKCEPNESAWEGPHWKALLFKLSDKHYYQYHANVGTPTTPPTGPEDTTYSLGAVGDLDCDGTYSTFYQILKGSRHPIQTHLNCRVQAQQVSIFKETE